MHELLRLCERRMPPMLLHLLVEGQRHLLVLSQIRRRGIGLLPLVGRPEQTRLHLRLVGLHVARQPYRPSPLVLAEGVSHLPRGHHHLRGHQGRRLELVADRRRRRRRRHLVPERRGQREVLDLPRRPRLVQHNLVLLRLPDIPAHVPAIPASVAAAPAAAPAAFASEVSSCIDVGGALPGTLAGVAAPPTAAPGAFPSMVSACTGLEGVVPGAIGRGLLSLPPLLCGARLRCPSARRTRAAAGSSVPSTCVAGSAAFSFVPTLATRGGNGRHACGARGVRGLRRR
mmetsp:Transcript_47611/g.132770  ORF Transcript_47611/g.132770 Transcript_47611/m.132770 type:complete len:286 (+) Transcript_47611:971-1828(+)